MQCRCIRARMASRARCEPPGRRGTRVHHARTSSSMAPPPRVAIARTRTRVRSKRTNELALVMHACMARARRGPCRSRDLVRDPYPARARQPAGHVSSVHGIIADRRRPQPGSLGVVSYSIHHCVCMHTLLFQHAEATLQQLIGIYGRTRASDRDREAFNVRTGGPSCLLGENTYAR